MLENIANIQQQIPSPNPTLVDELVNLVPSSVNPIDQVVNPIPSSIESIDQVIDSISLSIDPTLPLESEVKVVDPIPPLVNPNLPRKSDDVSQVFLVSTDSSGQGVTSPIPTKPPPSNEVVIFNWGALLESCLPSYINSKSLFKFVVGKFLILLSMKVHQLVSFP